MPKFSSHMPQFPSRSSAPPPACEVPLFTPLRVRGGRLRLGRLVRHRRRAVAAGLAMTAAALVAAGPREPGPSPAPVREAAGPDQERRVVESVTAPVRIADAAAVRLLRPGDRVDVVAAGDAGARVVATRARVVEVPGIRDAAAEGGALVVLSVPRATAARLAGAGATSRLAVTLW